MELIKFLKEKPRRGWKADRRELELFTEILDNHPLNKEGSAKDDDGWTPMHHLAGRAQDPSKEHVKMFELVRDLSMPGLTPDRHVASLPASARHCDAVLTDMPARSVAPAHARLSQRQR